jgi:hypothetical protein
MVELAVRPSSWIYVPPQEITELHEVHWQHWRWRTQQCNGHSCAENVHTQNHKLFT